MDTHNALHDKALQPPRDAIAAVTHAEPYAWYRERAEHAPLAHDATSGLWVAASAEAVRAALGHAAARVRPPAEPVPRALAGGASGALFARWARMNDGTAHAGLKPVLHGALDATPLPAALQPDRAACKAAAADRAVLDALLLAWPVQAMAQMLGLAPAEAVAREVRALVAGLLPQVDAAAREQGDAAASALAERWPQARATPLAALLIEAAHAAGLADAVLRANAVSLLVQTQDATAGLVANTLRLLAHEPVLARAVQNGEVPLPAVLAEVLRFDAPVQNTRRWLAEDALVCGQQLRAGDAVLVLLAAANHDARVNPRPERFDWQRQAPVLFTFGLGAHACPGQRLAQQLAAALLRALFAAGLQPASLRGSSQAWYPLANARIARFGA